MSDLTNRSQIAWTYLRRNRDYQKEAHHHMARQHVKVRKTVFPYSRQAEADLGARKWALLAFADPEQDTSPFWHPDMSDMTLNAEIQHENTDPETPPFIQMLREANSEVQGLRLLDGRLCLSVSSGAGVAQLMFPPGTTLNGNSRVMFMLSISLDMSVSLENTKVLWDISRGRIKKRGCNFSKNIVTS